MPLLLLLAAVQCGGCVVPSEEPTRSELEAIWRTKVWEARAQYNRAAAKLRRAQEEQQQG